MAPDPIRTLFSETGERFLKHSWYTKEPKTKQKSWEWMMGMGNGWWGALGVWIKAKQAVPQVQVFNSHSHIPETTSDSTLNNYDKANTTVKWATGSFLFSQCVFKFCLHYTEECQMCNSMSEKTTWHRNCDTLAHSEHRVWSKSQNQNQTKNPNEEKTLQLMVSR